MALTVWVLRNFDAISWIGIPTPADCLTRNMAERYSNLLLVAKFISFIREVSTAKKVSPTRRIRNCFAVVPLDG